ncbi:MAG TPA: ADP-ribose pyrophosphatase [Clostridiales bacterium]|nr:ADP-ribose pyrophosphatase [Clostridiales bacterium]
MDERISFQDDLSKMYEKGLYDVPYVMTDSVVFAIGEIEKKNYRKLPEKELKVLLIKRGTNSFWELPGGFIHKGVDIDKSAKIKLQQKTGVNDIHLEQIFTYGGSDRDKRGRIVSICYIALIKAVTVSSGKEFGAEEAEWFKISTKLIQSDKEEQTDGYRKESIMQIVLNNNIEILSAKVKYVKTVKANTVEKTIEIIESNGIGYDHAEMILYAEKKLKNKLEHSDIAFRLMPQKFTLMELQQVYETIIKKEYSKANFQRKIKRLLIETDGVMTGAGFRPAKLYMFNTEWDEEE